MLCLFHFSYATKCYVCANCADPFNKDADGVTTMDCDSGTCLKTKGNLPGVGDGMFITISHICNIFCEF